MFVNVTPKDNLSKMKSYIELAWKEAEEYIKKYPQHKDDIVSMYQLFRSEVEEGASEFHEYNTMINAIKQIINENV